jgi:hypothetical protein
MAESHVISALTNKRSELLGEIDHLEALIKEHKENLLTIDKTIYIFDSSYNLKSIKAKRVVKDRYFKVGEAKVLLLDALRKLGRPAKTDEIVDILIDKKSLEIQSEYEKSTFQKSVVASLSRAVDNGLIERVGRDGLTMIWQIRKPN